MKDLRVVFYMIGIEIHRDMANEKLWLSKKAYIECVFARYNM